MNAYDFEFESIDGRPMPLKAYEGKALLVVNTASFCGYTKQYAGLEALWRDYQDKGLVLVGVPSSSFHQEYGDNAKIKSFCDTRYGISFPMTESNPVRGDKAHPFYTWVRDTGGKDASPGWNFNKVLVDAEGRWVCTFGAGVKPDSAELRGAIEKVLP